MSETVTTTMNKSATNPEETTEVLVKEPQVVTTDDDDEKMVRSGVTGAVIGFLFGGPLLSALLGFTAAYASQKKGTQAGDYARSLGEFGVTVRDKALELDEKHQIAEKSTKVATDAWDKAKQYDGKYNLLDKTRDTVVYFWVLSVNYVREHRLLERGVEVTGKGYEYVADKLGANNEEESTTSQKKED